MGGGIVDIEYARQHPPQHSSVLCGYLTKNIDLELESWNFGFRLHISPEFPVLEKKRCSAQCNRAIGVFQGTA